MRYSLSVLFLISLFSSAHVYSNDDKVTVGIFSYPYKHITSNNPRYTEISQEIRKKKFQMLRGEGLKRSEIQELLGMGGERQLEQKSYHDWLPWSFAYERDVMMHEAGASSRGVITLTRDFLLSSEYSQQEVMETWSPLKSHCKRLERLDKRDRPTQLADTCELLQKEIELFSLGVFYKTDMASGTATFGLTVTNLTDSGDGAVFRVRLAPTFSQGNWSKHKGVLQSNTATTVSELWTMDFTGTPSTLWLKIEISFRSREKVLPPYRSSLIPLRRR